jgi:hypothetical protein
MRWLAGIGALMTITGAEGIGSPAATDFAWLAGTWCGETDETTSEEMWTTPRGGQLLGVHRDTRAGRSTGFEFLRIELHGGGATYFAQPGGGSTTAFELRASGPRSASFANERHDFPKRIVYERLGRSKLRARVDDGTDRGKAQEWVWSRCGR